MTTSPIRTHEPTPSAEGLWTVRKGERSFKAELLPDSRGCEVRFFSEEHWFASHVLGSRDLAIQYAGVIQNDLIANGWVKTAG